MSMRHDCRFCRRVLLDAEAQPGLLLDRVPRLFLCLRPALCRTCLAPAMWDTAAAQRCAIFSAFLPAWQSTYSIARLSTGGKAIPPVITPGRYCWSDDRTTSSIMRSDRSISVVTIGDCSTNLYLSIAI